MSIYNITIFWDCISYIYYYIVGFYDFYYINTCLELLFSIILGIIFFPLKISPLYYIIIESKSITFLAEIKEAKKKNLNISKLKKNILKKVYKKKEYPLIFVGPFTKTKNVFDSLHLGMVK